MPSNTNVRRKRRILFSNLTFFLVAVIVAEGLSILFLKNGAGDLFREVGRTILQSADQLVDYIYKQVGPMILPFTVLGTVLALAVKKLTWCYRKEPGGYDPKKLFAALTIVEVVSPGFGFWGTCSGLMEVMGNIDPNLSQKLMLPALCKGASTAFVTTIIGLALSIMSYVSSQVFKHFFPVQKIEEKSRMVIPSHSNHRSDFDGRITQARFNTESEKKDLKTYQPALVPNNKEA